MNIPEKMNNKKLKNSIETFDLFVVHWFIELEFDNILEHSVHAVYVLRPKTKAMKEISRKCAAKTTKNVFTFSFT